MGVDIFQVDAFTAVSFQGNPAAVCLLSSPWTSRKMQDMAREMNLSETAFVCRQEDGFSLRWFTPLTEVSLCGHATLASAHVLYETGRMDRKEPIHFHTLSGPLTAICTADWIHVDLPAEVPYPCKLPEQLAESLGIVRMVYAGRNRLDYLIAVDSAEQVRNLRPDFSRLAEAIPASGVIVTSLSDQTEYDYVCRYFDPGEGLDEDPVTGSAHCCLGPYWGKLLRKETLTAGQLSARGGLLHVSTVGDRVVLSGQAATILRGEMVV
ncbi:MAG: phenazine biosynthesis protein PhzF family [Firmicutes bacterium]|nr:phenazine biosynthesis protein PhzF family [Bacillota bacterium]